MIDFQPFDITNKAEYAQILRYAKGRGCEYSFVNLYLWGRQKAAFIENHLVCFSQFHRRTVYLFPIGPGDKKPVLDAVIADARERGIPAALPVFAPVRKPFWKAFTPVCSNFTRIGTVLTMCTTSTILPT